MESMWKRSLAGIAAVMMSGCGAVPQPPALTPMPAFGQVAPAVQPASTAAAKPKAAPSPSKAAPTGKTTPKATKAHTAAGPTAKAAATIPADSLASVMAAVRPAWQAVQGLRVHVVSWENDGKSDSTMELDADILKPSRLHAKLTRSSADPGTVGTELSWSGGTDLRVKTKLLGIPLSLNLPINDKRLVGGRGWTMADTSVIRLMDAVIAPDAALTYLGKAQMGDVVIDLVEFENATLTPGITKQRLGFDRVQHALVVRDMVAGDKVVSKSQYSQVHLEAPPAAVFDI
jgi:hypothetical protein